MGIPQKREVRDCPDQSSIVAMAQRNKEALRLVVDPNSVVYDDAFTEFEGAGFLGDPAVLIAMNLLDKTTGRKAV